jgi:hypothetical protein
MPIISNTSDTLPYSLPYYGNTSWTDGERRPQNILEEMKRENEKERETKKEKKVKEKEKEKKRSKKINKNKGSTKSNY